MNATQIWLLIFVLAAVAGWADDIRMRLKRAPERDAHGRFRKHGQAESDTQADAIKSSHAADEPASKERP